MPMPSFDVPAEGRRPVPLYRLMADVSASVRATWDDVLVTAEISNCKHATSGHVYLTLKDDRSQLKAVVWRGVADRLRAFLADGLQVVVRGELTVYEPRGDLQLVISSVQPAGEGALQKAFEALKARLQAEGLFDPTRKRMIGRYPRVIGIVTSRTGAVLSDMLTILRRRYPLAHVIVAPVKVQGDGAADEIARAIRAFNRIERAAPDRADVLIVGRGGGSAEDLWAFNEEPVARAIHASGIPVISAVGHETDVTIADLVADLRAGTPSMAAEQVATPIHEILSSLADGVDGAAARVLRIADRLRRRVEHLRRAVEFHAPFHRIQRLAQRNDELAGRLDRAMSAALRRRTERLAALAAHLGALDPLRPLAHGFALVQRDDRLVRSVHDLEPGHPVSLRFADGRASATVDTLTSTVDSGGTP